MSITQLREGIRRAPRAEKLRLFALLKHDLRTKTPARQAALEKAHEGIDAGKFVTLKQLKRLSAETRRKAS
jgi:hypothetical protein